jgi:hypothetical protein
MTRETAQVQGLLYLRVTISIQKGTHPWPKSFRSLGTEPVHGGAPPKPMTLDMLGWAYPFKRGPVLGQGPLGHWAQVVFMKGGYPWPCYI